MNSQTAVNVVLAILSWAGSGLITYGFVKAKMLDFERRLTTLEDRHNEFVTRVEYDGRHNDYVRQLERMENKIDKVILALNKP